jgi:hypothetical protein
VREVTIHFLCHSSRFSRPLGQGRAGDYSAPFPLDRLAAENQRAVRSYAGDDPYEELRVGVKAFCSELSGGDELMPHQLRPIPVSLQVLFGVNELAIPHDDVAMAVDRRYEPPPETVAVIRLMPQRRHGRDVASWSEIQAVAGRTP